MNTITVSKQQLFLLMGNHAIAPMLELAAQMALTGPLRALDGGNCFNVHQIARNLRRATPHMYPALERIYLARAFTCYEVVTLITQAPADGIPTLLPELLTTFYDEDVPLEETQRLLRSCLQALRRLCLTQPVVISASPPNQRIAERLVLLEMLRESADRMVTIEDAPETVSETQLRLL